MRLCYRAQLYTHFFAISFLSLDRIYLTNFTLTRLFIPFLSLFSQQRTTNTRSYSLGTIVAIQKILRVKIAVEVEVLAVVQTHRLIQVLEVLHPIVEPHEGHVIQIEAVLERSIPKQFPNLGMSQASRHSNR